MATIEAKQKTSNLPWLIILGALAILGIAAWIVQLTQDSR